MNPGMAPPVFEDASKPSMPQPFRILLHGSTLGPLATAAAEVIEEMCDRMIEKRRSTLAASAGVGAADIGFDQPTEPADDPRSAHGRSQAATPAARP
jgi:hypothetical protein